MYSDFCIDLRIGDPIAMSVHHAYLKSDENFKGFFTSLTKIGGKNLSSISFSLIRKSRCKFAYFSIV